MKAENSPGVFMLHLLLFSNLGHCSCNSSICVDKWIRLISVDIARRRRSEFNDDDVVGLAENKHKNT
jgi:hypothetical protein